MAQGTDIVLSIFSCTGTKKHDTYINEGSVARFSLMEDDSVTIKLSLEEELAFEIGDYIDFSTYKYENVEGKPYIFPLLARIGKYCLTQDYTPVYNENTGGYEYSLKFDAWYYLLKNRIFKYLPRGGGQESSWSLTARPSVFLKVFKSNLVALGYAEESDDIFYIEPGFDTNAITLTFSNESLIDALSSIAKAINDGDGCDWWFDGTKFIFGVFENHNEPSIDLALGENVENYSCSKGKSDKATRIYLYGSQKNITKRYRRILKFNANTVVGNTLYDKNKEINQDMFPASALTKNPTSLGEQYIEFYRKRGHSFNKFGYDGGKIQISTQLVAAFGVMDAVGSVDFDIEETNIVIPFTLNMPLNVSAVCDVRMYREAEFSGEDGRDDVTYEDSPITLSKFTLTTECKYVDLLKHYLIKIGRIKKEVYVNTRGVLEVSISFVAKVDNLQIEEKKFDGYVAWQQNKNYTAGGRQGTDQYTHYSYYDLGNDATLTYKELYNGKEHTLKNITQKPSEQNWFKDKNYGIREDYSNCVVYLAKINDAWYAVRSDYATNDFDGTSTRGNRENGYSTVDITNEPKVKLTNANKSVALQLDFGNGIVSATLNPNFKDKKSPEAKVIHISNASRYLGQDYEIVNIIRGRVPYSYFVNQYTSEDSINAVATNRLMLPNEPCYVVGDELVRRSKLGSVDGMTPVYGGHGYIDSEDGMPKEKIIEKVYVNEDIYPSFECVVSRAELKNTQKEKDDEGDETGVNLLTWWIYTRSIIGFSNDYIVEGKNLSLTFRTGKLAGMTFELTYRASESDATQTAFEIVRNEDYTTILPNELLFPESGNEFSIFNYDTSFIDAALEDDAELRLLEFGLELAEKVKEDTNSYTATMMCDWMEEYSKSNEEMLKLVYGQLVQMDFAKDQNRIIGLEYNLDYVFDRFNLIIGRTSKYTRLGDIEGKLGNIAKSGTTYYGGGGSSASKVKGVSVQIIGIDSKETPTDTNVFSATRVLQELDAIKNSNDSKYLSKNSDDETTYDLTAKRLIGREGIYSHGDTLLEGDVKFGKSDFIPNLAGGSVYTDKEGNVIAEFDKLFVHQQLHAKEAVIEKVNYIGGTLVLTPADGFQSVEVFGLKGGVRQETVNNTADEFLIAWSAEGENGKDIKNLWKVGDLALAQSSNLGNGSVNSFDGGYASSYWWRKVTDVGTINIQVQGSKIKCNYIIVSNTIKSGSSLPYVGETVVQLGSQNDIERQNAIILSANGTGAPYIYLYRGIKTFSLTSAKCIGQISPQKVQFLAEEFSFMSESYNGGGVGTLEELVGNITEIVNNQDESFEVWQALDNKIPLPYFNKENGRYIENTSGMSASQAINYSSEKTDEWATPDEKQSHVGDYLISHNGLCYQYKAVILVSNGNGTYHIYSGDPQDNTSGLSATLCWVLVADDYLVQALTIANSVQGQVNDIASDLKITAVEKEFLDSDFTRITADLETAIKTAYELGESGASTIKEKWSKTAATKEAEENVVKAFSVLYYYYYGNAGYIGLDQWKNGIERSSILATSETTTIGTADELTSKVEALYNAYSYFISVIDAARKEVTDGITEQVTTITSDGWVTAQERQDLIEKYTQYVNEMLEYRALAEGFKSTSQKDNYTSFIPYDVKNNDSVTWGWIDGTQYYLPNALCAAMKNYQSSIAYGNTSLWYKLFGSHSESSPHPSSVGLLVPSHQAPIELSKYGYTASTLLALFTSIDAHRTAFVVALDDARKNQYKEMIDDAISGGTGDSDGNGKFDPDEKRLLYATWANIVESVNISKGQYQLLNLYSNGLVDTSSKTTLGSAYNALFDTNGDKTENDGYWWTLKSMMDGIFTSMTTTTAVPSNYKTNWDNFKTAYNTFAEALKSCNQSIVNFTNKQNTIANTFFETTSNGTGGYSATVKTGGLITQSNFAELFAKQIINVADTKTISMSGSIAVNQQYDVSIEAKNGDTITIYLGTYSSFDYIHFDVYFRKKDETELTKQEGEFYMSAEVGAANTYNIRPINYDIDLVRLVATTSGTIRGTANTVNIARTTTSNILSSYVRASVENNNPYIEMVVKRSSDNLKNQLLETGIRLEDNKIDMFSDNFTLKNRNGEVNLGVDGNGNVEFRGTLSTKNGVFGGLKRNDITVITCKNVLEYVKWEKLTMPVNNAKRYGWVLDLEKTGINVVFYSYDGNESYGTETALKTKLSAYTSIHKVLANAAVSTPSGYSEDSKDKIYIQLPFYAEYVDVGSTSNVAFGNYVNTYIDGSMGAMANMYNKAKQYIGNSISIVNATGGDDYGNDTYDITVCLIGEVKIESNNSLCVGINDIAAGESYFGRYDSSGVPNTGTYTKMCIGVHKEYQTTVFGSCKWFSVYGLLE